jgi:transcriptional regulator with XRE-family HTH domain
MYQTFGDIIQSERKKRKLTLKEVANETGIDFSTLAKIEKNQRGPSEEFLKQIAKVLALDERDLRKNYLSDVLVEKIYNDINPVEVLKLAEKKVEYKIQT